MASNTTPFDPPSKWVYIPSDEDLQFMRNIVGLTQREVADELDITLDHLGAVERGAETPSLDLLEGLLEIYEREWPEVVSEVADGE